MKNVLIKALILFESPGRLHLFVGTVERACRSQNLNEGGRDLCRSFADAGVSGVLGLLSVHELDALIEDAPR